MTKRVKLVRKNAGKAAATSTIALMGLTFVGQNDVVGASEVVTPTTLTENAITTQTDKANQVTTVGEASALVAANQATVNSAKEELANQEGAVASQSALVKTATSEVATLTDQLASAVAEHSEAIQLKSAATSEYLSELTSQVTSATTSLSSESATAEQVSSEMASQSQVVSSESEVASEVARLASEATSRVSDLTYLVEAPEKITANLASAKSEVSRLESELKVAETAVTTASATAQTELAKQLADKQAELSKKNDELLALQANQATGVVAKTNVVGSNKIVLPNTFKTQVLPALTTIEKSGWTFSAGYNAAVSQLTKQIEAGLQGSKYGSGSTTNAYKSIAADTTRYIDPNNLSTEIQNEMAQFVGDLLNDVRGQLGLTVFAVTKTAQEFASAIASEYRRAGFGVSSNPHSSAIIGKHAQNAGLSATDNRGYESLGFFGNARTVDQLKNYFYNGIVYMLFNDVSSSYGHTISLLQNSNNGPYYLGVSSTSNAQHIYVIPSANIRNASQFSTTSLLGKVTAVDNTAQITTLKATIASLTQEISNLKDKSGHVSSNANVVAAQQKVVALQQRLATAKSSVTAFTDLSKQLAKSRIELLAQLEEAKQTEALYLEQQLAAQDKLTTEIKKLQVLQVAVNASAQKVKELKNAITSWNELLAKLSDPTLVEKAAEKVADLTTALELAQANHAVEAAKLELLMLSYNEALVVYETAKESLAQSQTVLSNLVQQSNVANLVHKQQSNSLQKTVTQSPKSSVTADLANVLKQTAKGNKSSVATLPETGDHTAAISVLSGVSMISLAAMVLDKKRLKK
ncbi:SEC10/PgrA surface exclusion domain-containing protein [Streptococcus pluranimalium]|uniref:SEC10/PgrA surface exclusion domain-containing protein n=1 Tax=Streptococcus pluranimalium TaxID=82348 RepID=UPI0031390BEF